MPKITQSKALIQKAKVIANQKIEHRYYKIILNAPRIARLAIPGQFINVRINNSYAPLLRRPFSIHRVSGLKIEILYEVIGRGTEILAQKKAGEYLDIIGPLGNGFSLLTTHYSLLVAGGIGVAPLVFLFEKLVKLKTQNSPAKAGSRKMREKLKTLVLIGAKRKNEILCEKEFKRLGANVKIATDDGSQGFKGKVTDLLTQLLLTMNYKLSTIYACGPRLMLKEIRKISERWDISAQISLEEHIACGIGACLGCVVKTREGYKRVCKDGPIFNAEEIVW